ncbi:MAG TPA: hypothetical protein VJ692_01440, partial [Nitrospiraceae bacterium]|nr:hypothetical protein [Nitrospiraceae bacterium]
SPVKLGFSVAWAAFWTGVPIKIVLVLLLLAMGVHPWEMPGLAVLLLLSIPIDIWALGVTAKTVFLDRLRVKAPDGIGLTLWWQVALLSAVYVPIAYVIQTQTVAIAKSITTSILSISLLHGLPIAEKISIELVLWGSVATVMAIILVLGWLFLFGKIVHKQVLSSPPADAPYPALVRQWDLMRVPADQPLLLAAFTATGVVLVLLFWAFMPVTTPHPHEEYKNKGQVAKAQPPLRPAEALHKTERVIAQAEAAVQTLEAKAQGEKKETKDGKDKDKGAGSAKEPSPKAVPAKAVKKEMATESHEHEHAADGHQH